MGEVLRLEDVNVTYKTKSKDVYAVKDASFAIDQGDSLGVVGESGSGKSTLAMALLHLLRIMLLLPPVLSELLLRREPVL